MNIKKVLLTGGRAPSSLELARFFSKQNIEVHIAESFPFAISKKSNSIKKFHKVSKPKQKAKEFILDLIGIIDKEEIDLFIPTCEEIFYVSKYKNLLPKSCIVFVEEFEKMKVVHHKYRFIQIAESLNLPTPKTVLIDNISDWLEFNEKNKEGTSFVAKPVFSRFSNDLRFLPQDKHKMIFPNEQNPWVIQEFIDGEQFCTYSIVKNGKIFAHTTYKTEYRAGKGASIAFQHIEEKQIYDWIEKFVKNLNFTGQIAFDFIKNKEGKAFPIECNPRLTSGIHLFRNTNVIEAFLQEKENVIEPSGNKGIMITMAMVLFLSQNIKANGIKHFLQTIIRYQDVVFDRKDIKPLFYQYYSYYKLWKMSKKTNLTLLETSTHDITWDGEEI